MDPIENARLIRKDLNSYAGYSRNNWVILKIGIEAVYFNWFIELRKLHAISTLYSQKTAFRAPGILK